MPRYTVSILAFNKIDVTRKCLATVLPYSLDCSVILTNNGSTDGTKEYFDGIAEAWPNVRVVHNSMNLGFQVPHMKALDMCDTEFFVLLNNDTEVPREWLKKLEEPFADQSVALSGPFGNCCSLTNEFHGYPGAKFEYLEGSCLMCRTRIVKQHGLFADYLEFAYGEDSDLSLRMRRLGYRLARVPIAVKHAAGSTSKTVPGVWGFQARNHAVLKERWAHYLSVRRMDYPIVVRRNEAIGDVLLTTPVIHALAEENPLCQIYVQTKFPELFAGAPCVKHAGQNVGAIANSLVIDLNMAYENHLDMPIIEAYAAKANVTLRDRRLRFYPSKNDEETATSMLGDVKRPMCIMHIGPTTWPGKNWPMDRFSAVAHWLIERGWSVVLIGNACEFRIPGVKDLRARTTIGQSGAIMAQAQLFVGLDSFPMHLAMSQLLPVVAVFGATLPGYIVGDGVIIPVHAPIGSVPCIGARHRAHGSTYVHCDGECMRAVGVNAVIDAVQQLIGYS